MRALQNGSSLAEEAAMFVRLYVITRTEAVHLVQHAFLEVCHCSSIGKLTGDVHVPTSFEVEHAACTAAVRDAPHWCTAS